MRLLKFYAAARLFPIIVICVLGGLMVVPVINLFFLALLYRIVTAIFPGAHL